MNSTHPSSYELPFPHWSPNPPHIRPHSLHTMKSQSHPTSPLPLPTIVIIVTTTSKLRLSRSLSSNYEIHGCTAKISSSRISDPPASCASCIGHVPFLHAGRFTNRGKKLKPSTRLGFWEAGRLARGVEGRGEMDEASFLRVLEAPRSQVQYSSVRWCTGGGRPAVMVVAVGGLSLGRSAPLGDMDGWVDGRTVWDA